MAQNTLFDSPATYLRSSQLPEGTSIISNGCTYGVDAKRFLFEKPSGTDLRIYYGNIDEEDSFPTGDKATLPNGLSYVRTCDVWLLAPIRVPQPVSVTTALSEHKGYRIIKQSPEATDPDIKDPLVIPFNVPMCWARDSDLPGSDEEAFAPSSDGKRKKITIALSLPLIEPFNGHLKSEKAQGNATMTKGPLTKFIVREVEKTLDLEKNNVLAFADADRKFVKEVTLDDLFLVNLVQKSKATFQPTIALRI